MAQEMAGRMIGGRYRIRSVLGRGGMGTVWSCLDETLDRDVAVKEVGLLPGASITDAARAYREARSSAELANPHVVTVYDVVEEAGRLWMVMEEVPGRSLSQLIDQNDSLDPATVANIGAQIADGLAAAHAAGIVHRDVKPANILVREDGVAKISDFGIARIQGDATLTGAGQLTGTPSYFPPEVARGAQPGPAADVWALGASLYAAVEGHPAYPTWSNPVAVLHQIATSPPPPTRRAGFLTEPLARMLDRNPASRWSMADAAHVLGRLAHEHRPHRTLAASVRSAGPPIPEPTAVPSKRGFSDEPTAHADLDDAPQTRPAAPPISPGPARRPRRRRGAPLLALAVLALLLGAGALWLVTRQDAGGGGSTATQPPASSPTSHHRAKPSPAHTSAGSGHTARPPSSAAQNASSPGSAAQMEQLVRDYYSQAPGGTDSAWQMLGPREQAQGRASYNAFWQGIDRVDVQQASADPAAQTVDVTLVYHRTNGSTSTERKREGLVRSGNRYLLDTDEPRS